MGAGSWGTAFAATLADAGVDAAPWGRRAQVVDQVNAGRNGEHLPRLALPSTAWGHDSDATEAMAGRDLVALAVPSQTLRANLQQWGPLPAQAHVLSR